MKKVGISGHSLNIIGKDIKNIKKKIFDYLNVHYKDKNVVFNIGGAHGTDNIVGEWCLINNKEYNLFLPYNGNIERQSKGWNNKEIEILKKLDNNKLCIDKKIYSGYFERNRNIVNNSDELIVWYDENKEKSGTSYTINYALKNKTINIFNMKTLKYIKKTNN